MHGGWRKSGVSIRARPWPGPWPSPWLWPSPWPWPWGGGGAAHLCTGVAAMCDRGEDEHAIGDVAGWAGGTRDTSLPTQCLKAKASQNQGASQNANPFLYEQNLVCSGWVYQIRSKRSEQNPTCLSEVDLETLYKPLRNNSTTILFECGVVSIMCVSPTAKLRHTSSVSTCGVVFVVHFPSFHKQMVSSNAI